MEAGGHFEMDVNEDSNYVHNRFIRPGMAKRDILFVILAHFVLNMINFFLFEIVNQPQSWISCLCYHFSWLLLTSTESLTTKMSDFTPRSAFLAM